MIEARCDNHGSVYFARALADGAWPTTAPNEQAAKSIFEDAVKSVYGQQTQVLWI